MKWIEAVVRAPDEAGADMVCAALIGCGVEGFEIVDHAQMQRFIEENPLKWDYVDEDLLARQDEGVQVRFYVADSPEGRSLLEAVRGELASLPGLGGLGLCTTADLDDTVWLEGWRKHYKLFRIGHSVVVCPSWEEYEKGPGEVVFVIEPGHVFGTGLHQSTALCIRRLESLGMGASTKILDVGCGSGILSIVGLLLGAGSATAIDTDPEAVAIARKNASLNGIEAVRYDVMAGNILEDEGLRARVGQGYDIVIANIVADVVIALAVHVPRLLVPGGSFIASGIIEERLGDVLEAFGSVGLGVVDVSIEDGWAAVRATA